MADFASPGTNSDGIAFLVSAGIVYEIIAAACSSPQTTEINAGTRADTLMKWVHIGLAQPLADHAEHQRVIHQPAAVHGRLRQTPELGAARHRGTQQIAARDLGDPEALHETLRLSALARSGRPQQDDAHVFFGDETAAVAAATARHVTGGSPGGQTASAPPQPSRAPRRVRYS